MDSGEHEAVVRPLFRAEYHHDGASGAAYTTGIEVVRE